MSATATLTTSRLEIVPLDLDRDAGSLHALFGDPLIDPYGWAKPASSVAETRERLRSALAENGGWTWVIRLQPSGDALGTIGIHSDQGTSIRGLSWYLRRSHWGQGIMSEAAPIVVDHLLAQPGITGVEAWIDTRNVRSIGVARHAGLHEASRMARRYGDHLAQQVVMARAAEPGDSDVVAVRAVLPVRDVTATARTLSGVLGMHVAFQYPDPPTMVRLTVTPWTGSAGIDLVQENGSVSPASVTIDVGVATDLIHDRALAAGLEVDGPPQDQVWHQRTCTILLPEGHRIQVRGALRPERAS
jgi:RimJ/RimL family protein N-acetyltransferase/catechol 2,3-dioxygenase-like lactoylglutathione lyase family enzyme